MDCSTSKEILITAQIFQMLIGVVTLTIRNQPLVMFSRLEKQPSVGEARSRHAWLYQLFAAAS